jgi:hypothetical protein
MQSFAPSKEALTAGLWYVPAAHTLSLQMCCDASFAYFPAAHAGQLFWLITMASTALEAVPAVQLLHSTSEPPTPPDVYMPAVQLLDLQPV